MRRSLPLALICALAFVPPAASEESEPGCPPDTVEQDEFRYLRMLSLDLRGVVPSLADYAVVEDEGEVPGWLIDEWLDSEAFVQRVVRKHRDLLWNNVGNVQLTAAPTSLINADGAPALWIRQRATRFRGAAVPCIDEPAEFDGDQVLATEQPDGTLREGWVEVAPYWAPDTVVKVCAFDAQERPVASTGTDCSTRDGFADAECGCGPDLNWCRRAGNTEPVIRESFGTDIDLRVAELVRSDASYLDLFTGRTMWVNGPQVHYWRHQLQVAGQTRLYPAPVDLDLLPDLHYTDDNIWVEVPLGEQHAGVLTAPGFLLRFQTDRARANRFYGSFLCQPFQPPDDGIPASDGPVPLDLQIRDGCKYCHALLEPAGAYWGRWPENGAGYLDEAEFPVEREDCLACATTGATCAPDCANFYLTEALVPEQEPYLGMLKSFEFRREEHEAHVDLGPEALMNNGIVDGRFTACTSRTAAEWLVGRPLVSDEEPWIHELELGFVGGGFSYKELVRAIVTSPVYRRIR